MLPSDKSIEPQQFLTFFVVIASEDRKSEMFSAEKMLGQLVDRCFAAAHAAEGIFFGNHIGSI